MAVAISKLDNQPFEPSLITFDINQTIQYDNNYQTTIFDL